jgi:uncharacterized protein (TIGR02246 family)
MRPFPAARFAIFAVLCIALTVRGSAQPDQRETLSASDVAGIRADLQRYRSGWLTNDADAVRKSFTKDAVLMPHHGLAPVVGMAAINDFWWPASATRTTITKFEQTIDEIGGDGKLAYVRGRSEVAWRVEDQGKIQHWHNSGNFMTILKKQADGGWRISHLIWDDPPNQLE